MKTIASGIILYRLRETSNELEFFLCTPGGPLWGNRLCWAPPKGLIEEGEDPFKAALREFKEETGQDRVSSNEGDYKYHGLIEQRKEKLVHIFSSFYRGQEFENLHSNTFTWEVDGNDYPEVGGYSWMTLAEILSLGKKCQKAYIPVYRQIEEEHIS